MDANKWGCLEEHPLIPLQSLQQGQQGYLLIKTENGQYQLLRVGPAPAKTITVPQAQTIQMSTMPAQPGSTADTSMASGPLISPGGSSGHLSGPSGLKLSFVAPLSPPLPLQFQPQPQPQFQPQPYQLMDSYPPTVTIKNPVDKTMEKCRIFLTNLLHLSSKEPKFVETNVRNTIQELINAEVEAKEFCNRLERLLNASPQPCLIDFLKKILPRLRQSLVTREFVIEGIYPPAPHIAFATMPAPVQPVLMSTSNIQLPSEEEGITPILTTLLPPEMPFTMPSILVSPPRPIALEHSSLQQKSAPKRGNATSVLKKSLVPTKINMSGNKSKAPNKSGKARSATTSAALSKVVTPVKSLLKEKAKNQYSTQQFLFDDKIAEDDINDVVAMGGVNLAKESQSILGSTQAVGTQIRSCKDKFLVPVDVMEARVKAICAKHGLANPAPEVAALMNHALYQRLKNFIEKLVVIADHRMNVNPQMDERYEATQNPNGQLKFLEELDRVQKKRHDDAEREMLLKAAKSRSKNVNPEQAKLKAKAKEMKRAELEELRQREANQTALNAIGPRKKTKVELTGEPMPGPSGLAAGGLGGSGEVPPRPALNRIHLRDMLYVLEQDPRYSHSNLLFRAYLK